MCQQDMGRTPFACMIMIWTVPLLQVLLHDSMRGVQLVLKLRNHGDGFEVDGFEGNQYKRDLIA